MAEQKQENSSKIRNIISTEISRLLRLSGVHSGKLTVNGKLLSAWPLMLPTISKTEVNQK